LENLQIDGLDFRSVEAAGPTHSARSVNQLEWYEEDHYRSAILRILAALDLNPTLLSRYDVATDPQAKTIFVLTFRGDEWFEQIRHDPRSHSWSCVGNCDHNAL
jgi:hypothetical protein